MPRALPGRPGPAVTTDPLPSLLADLGLRLVPGETTWLRGQGLNLRLAAGDLERFRAQAAAQPDALREHLLAMASRAGGLPGWFVARSGVRLLLSRAEDASDAVMHLPISDGACALLTHCDPDESLITWLGSGVLDTWHQSVEELAATAEANLDRLLDEATLQVEELRGHRVGLLQIASAYKGSLILAPGLRRKVEPALGWPILAVVPCRDFLLLFSDRAAIPALAPAVMAEFDGSAHPVSNEVFEIDDEGFSAIGRYADAP